MTAPKPPLIWTVKELAALVQQLRTVQKASGVGYKTPAATSSAKSLEAQVDAAIAEIEKFHLL
jgi:hypothetical protein